MTPLSTSGPYSSQCKPMVCVAFKTNLTIVKLKGVKEPLNLYTRSNIGETTLLLWKKGEDSKTKGEAMSKIIAHLLYGLFIWQFIVKKTTF